MSGATLSEERTGPARLRGVPSALTRYLATSFFKMKSELFNAVQVSKNDCLEFKSLLQNYI